METIVYRDATRDDLGKIVAIYNSTVASRMVTADTQPVSVESKIAWFEEHGGDRPLWVVENEAREIVGWVSFQSFYGRPAYQATAEVSIYLDESKRGKGLGKAILAHVENSCSRFNIKTLVGYIFSHNAPSLALFHKAGFSDWALLPNIAELDGVERSLTIVGKRILK